MVAKSPGELSIVIDEVNVSLSFFLNGEERGFGAVFDVSSGRCYLSLFSSEAEV